MLSHRITYFRKLLGMSQAQLAKNLNMSPSAVGMYEQGRRIPDLNTLILLSNLFQISLDYLITGSEFIAPEVKKSRISDDCPCRTCYWKKYIEP